MNQPNQDHQQLPAKATIYARAVKLRLPVAIVGITARVVNLKYVDRIVGNDAKVIQLTATITTSITGLAQRN
jgi:hypothetical protein